MNKRNKARQKLELWVSENPDGYLQYSYGDIAKQVGISWITVQRCLYEIIAERDGILPSDVIQRRAKAGRKVGPKGLDSDVIDEIYNLSDEGMDPRDIAYTLKVGLSTVYRHLAEREA